MDTWKHDDRCTCSLAMVGGVAEAYNEPAFRYFLGVERRRAARSGRSVLVLVARIRGRHAERAVVSTERLFSVLWFALREVDFVGWFREGRLAGAVLAQQQERVPASVCRSIERRVAATLEEHLPPAMTDRLQLRVVQIRSLPRM